MNKLEILYSYLKASLSSLDFNVEGCEQMREMEKCWWLCKEIKEILLGLESGVDISVYADPRFTRSQMEEIRIGLESGVDISVYADPRFDGAQMKVIRLGLLDGIDVSIYANHTINHEYMWSIRRGLKKHINVSNHINILTYINKFNKDQFSEIVNGLIDGVDISVYDNPSFSWRHMGYIRRGLKHGLDMSNITPDINIRELVRMLKDNGVHVGR